MTIFRILNTGQTIRRDARKRVWMAMGVPAVVAPNTTLTLRADRVDEKYFITYTLRGVDRAPVEAVLPITSWTDFKAVCPRVMLPRAARYDDKLRPVALLMEFVLLDAEIASLRAAFE